MFDDKARLKKIIKIVILVLLVFALSYGIYYYVTTSINKKQGKIETPDRTEINTSIEKDSGLNLKEDIMALNLKYKDAISWLLVPGTNIDMPIFQSKDNNRYLRNDRDNVKTKWGETFMDYRCNINNMDNMSHFIIYGHNTTTDDHFTPLLKYKDKSFFDKNKVISMSTVKDNYKWEIFSVYTTNTEFFYIDTNFSNVAEYDSFLNTLKSKSMYDTEVALKSNDTILTLSTCDYSVTNGRFVVQARLVK